MGKVTITVDYENNAPAWWGAIPFAPGADPEVLPATCQALFEMGTDEITVSAEDAAAFRAWAEKLPGWDDGPEHAKHPFTFQEEVPS